jgi:hypothetical protein
MKCKVSVLVRMIRKLELKIVENLVEHSFFIVLPVELTVPKSKLSDLFIHYSRFGLGFGFFGSKLLRNNIEEEISKGDSVRISVGIHILPTDDTISPGKIITTKKIINCLREGEVCYEYSNMSRYNSDNIASGLLSDEDLRVEKRFVRIDTSTILSESETPFTKLIRHLWLDYEREDNT